MDKNKMTFDEKIAVLEQMHTKSAPEARAEIANWRDRMRMLQAQKEWLEHPNTKELAKLALEQVKSITATLGNTEGIPEAERTLMFAEKRAHFTYLAVLTQDPASEIETLEKKVDDEL